MYTNLELMGIYWHSIFSRRYGSISKTDNLITEKVYGSSRDMCEKDVLRLPVRSLTGRDILVESEIREFLAENYFKFRYSTLNQPKMYGVAVVYDSFLGRFNLKVDGRLITSLDSVSCWDSVICRQLERFSLEARKYGVGFFEKNFMYMDFVMTPVYGMARVGEELVKVYRADHIDVFSDSSEVFERFGVRDPEDDLYVLCGGEFSPVGSRRVEYFPREDYYFGGEGWEFYSK